MLLATILSAMAATVHALPLQQRDHCAPTRLTTTELWNIFPRQTNISRGPAPGFEVQSSSGSSEQEQVVVFRGIPEEATSCSLGWSQASREDRVFLVDGASGLLRVSQLAGLPDEDSDEDDEAEQGAVTYDSIRRFRPEQQHPIAARATNTTGPGTLSPDLTAWDGVEGPTEHLAGGVECGANVYLLMRLYDTTQDSHVYLGADEGNGFWLEYTTC